LGAGVVWTLVTAAVRAILIVWLLYALLPVQQEEVATKSPTGAPSTTGTPITTYSGAARIFAKVAIVLPVEFFYLSKPSALAFPALLGLITFLSTQDPTAGRTHLVILLLGNLVGAAAAAAAATVFDVSPPLPTLTLMGLLGTLSFARWMMTKGRR